MASKKVISAVRFEVGEVSYGETRATYMGPSVMESEVDGFLILTNRRLLFLHEIGHLKHSYHCRVQMRYEEIEAIQTTGRIARSVEIVDKSTRKHKLKLSDPDYIVAKIEKMMKTQSDNEKDTEVQRIVLDFADLRKMLEKGGVILETILCSHCGATISLPDSGDFVVCNKCGNKNEIRQLAERLGLRERL